MAAVLDHLSIQRDDVAASAAFYDAVLAPLGGGRVLDFGPVIGFGVAPKPVFWLGPRSSGEGSARRTSPSPPPIGGRSEPSSPLRWAPAPKCSTSPGCGSSTNPAYYGAFVRDPDGNNVEAVCHVPE